MNTTDKYIAALPADQQAIRSKCVHPSGTFVGFEKEEIQQSIPARFEQMVERFPHRLAVKDRSGEHTYTELNEAADGVAQAILSRLGESQEAVGLLLPPGFTAMAVILGVLKAGKFYVPLDPSLPRDRLLWMLEDAQVTLGVTNRENCSVIKQLGHNPGRWLIADEVDRGVPEVKPGCPVSPDNLACIIYTSGSTGNPKAVVHNHRNILHGIMRHTNVVPVSVEDRLTLLSSIAFIGAVRDSFSALLNGAALYVYDLRRQGLGNLADWLIQEEISIYRSVATVFRNLVDTLKGDEEFPKLRVIKLGSEAINKTDVELFKKYFSADCVLFIGMGTTETGTVAQYLIDRESQIVGDQVPVGYPAEDMQVLLLDGGGNRVGSNEIGEIAVRSRYISSGYWRNPDLTRAVFLPDPEDRDGCIYLTGDCGRMTADGRLIHVGRKDYQVKVRGYKIEVAEIDAALLALDPVKEAIVVPHIDPRGRQTLVAYIVARQGRPLSIRELRRKLAEKLPEYMIPSHFVFIDRLLLLPSGKVDRQALPKPEYGRPDLDDPFVAPGTPVERSLAKIWSEVLGLDRVGIHDNFIDLGGDSLLAGRIISRVIDEFQVELPPRSLFESPTVADMAMIIVHNQVKRVDQGQFHRVLVELETLSDEQAKQLLADENRWNTQSESNSR